MRKGYTGKAIAVLVVMVLIVGLFPAAAFACDDYKDKKGRCECGKKCECECIMIKVVVKWDDGDNKALRPKSVDAQLKGSNLGCEKQSYDEKVTVKSKTWQTVVAGLIGGEYTLTADAVQGYEAPTIAKEGNTFTVTYKLKSADEPTPVDPVDPVDPVEPTPEDPADDPSADPLVPVSGF